MLDRPSLHSGARGTGTRRLGQRASADSARAVSSDAGRNPDVTRSRRMTLATGREQRWARLRRRRILWHRVRPSPHVVRPRARGGWEGSGILRRTDPGPHRHAQSMCPGSGCPSPCPARLVGHQRTGCAPRGETVVTGPDRFTVIGPRDRLSGARQQQPGQQSQRHDQHQSQRPRPPVFQCLKPTVGGFAEVSEFGLHVRHLSLEIIETLKDEPARADLFVQALGPSGLSTTTIRLPT